MIFWSTIFTIIIYLLGPTVLPSLIEISDLSCITAAFLALSLGHALNRSCLVYFTQGK